MNISIPQKQPSIPLESDNREAEESLAKLRKRLETGQKTASDSIKETRARNLSQMRDTLQNPASGTIINVKQGKGTININTGSVDNQEARKKIPVDFFSKQTGFSSSSIQHKGGRL